MKLDLKGGLEFERYRGFYLTYEELKHVTGEDEVANGTFDVIARWHVGLKNYVIE